MRYEDMPDDRASRDMDSPRGNIAEALDSLGLAIENMERLAEAAGKVLSPVLRNVPTGDTDKTAAELREVGASNVRSSLAELESRVCRASAQLSSTFDRVEL